jgi:hypothetical protein
MLRTFIWEYDAGHGWLQVEVSEVIALGIAHQISEYSYLGNNGQIAYLEEDVDAPLFLEALKIAYFRKTGEHMKVQHRDSGVFHNTSPVRQLRQWPQQEVKTA